MVEWIVENGGVKPQIMMSAIQTRIAERMKAISKMNSLPDRKPIAGFREGTDLKPAVRKEKEFDPGTSLMTMFASALPEPKNTIGFLTSPKPSHLPSVPVTIGFIMPKEMKKQIATAGPVNGFTNNALAAQSEPLVIVLNETGELVAIPQSWAAISHHSVIGFITQ